MAIGLRLGSITDEIGAPDFFHAFFSTVSGNLEPAGWGTRFPVLMNGLYQGALETDSASAALAELKTVHAELAKLPVSKLVWDIENRSDRPPWGNDIASHITDLSNYFVTSTGRDFFAVLNEMVTEMIERGGRLEVVTT